MSVRGLEEAGQEVCLVTRDGEVAGLERVGVWSPEPGGALVAVCAASFGRVGISGLYFWLRGRCDG